MAERFAASLLVWVLVASAPAATPVSQAESQALSKVHVITIEGLRFNPGTLSVTRGDRIVWVNKDLFPHTATADGGAFDSKNVAPEESWSWVTERAGTFAYTCAFHPTMKGVVTVR